MDIELNHSRQGQITGLLGNFDHTQPNDLVTRSGMRISTPAAFDKLYRVYGNSWRIAQAQSLFEYAPGQTTATLSDLNFPKQFISASVVPAHSAAESICRDAGVMDRELLNDCIVDVSLTGQTSFASSAADTQLLFAGQELPPSGSSLQDLMFTGPIAGQLAAASGTCTILTSGGQFTADLVGNLGGQEMSVTVSVVAGYHGAGEYPLGSC
jgi:hypothetical protein